MSLATLTGTRAATPTTKATLSLTIGRRSYAVRLEWWTPENDHVILLDDVLTGQSTRVLDLQNRCGSKPGTAECSCRPGEGAVRCRHVRALVAAHLLPNWTMTEGE